ncbi:MAG: acyl-CoA dehydrogenase family protein [Desulfuromonadaceae bacterium]|nr:acyl-CoA dehydrogenase family protein [Desulfuromonadaceae bacterium]
MYSEEHNVFREAFRNFVKKELSPHVDEWEANGAIPRDVWKKMGAEWYLCPWLPEEFGGSEADFLYSVIIAEELIKGGAVSLMTPLHSDIIAPYISHLGNAEQKIKWLPGSASGDIVLAVAMTEPDTGSDLAGMRTHAERDGDDYVINGAKTFITNGIHADLVIVACRTDKDAKGTKGLSLICVERDTPGFTKGKKLEKMGLCASDTAELFFDDCRVPVANLLGEENRGFYYLMEYLQQERLMCSLQSLAMAEKMLELTLAYTKERKQFGKPICSFQHNAFKIVEMMTDIKLGRAFIDNLILKHMRNENVVDEVSMAKAWTGEMANKMAYQCVQLHGGYGFMDEYPISRYYRDVRPFSIFAGTTEIMKQIVAKNMGLM